MPMMPWSAHENWGQPGHRGFEAGSTFQPWKIVGKQTLPNHCCWSLKRHGNIWELYMETRNLPWLPWQGVTWISLYLLHQPVEWYHKRASIFSWAIYASIMSNHFINQHFPGIWKQLLYFYWWCFASNPPVWVPRWQVVRDPGGKRLVFSDRQAYVIRVTNSSRRHIACDRRSQGGSENRHWLVLWLVWNQWIMVNNIE